MPETAATLPTIADLHEAADRIAFAVRRTPLLPLPADGPGALAPGLYAKAENLQRTGSFKLRGALNVLAAMTETERARGVTTHSSGNHGQAVACAAATFNTAATVAIPEGAPEVKVARTKGWGATVVRSGGSAQERERAAREGAPDGATLIPPYDDAGIIAGQGTIGLEIVADLPEVANVLVPIGGGGLASGVAVALKALAPQARLIGVEPALAADAYESWRSGERVRWPAERTVRTVADGVRTQMVGELPWRILAPKLHGIVTVEEEQILDAAAWYPRHARTVVEPTGALTLAGWRRLIHGEAEVELADGPTVLVVSGGNLDDSALSTLLQRRDVR